LLGAARFFVVQRGAHFCSQVERSIADKTIRYGVIDSFCSVWRFKLENLVKGQNALATDQIIRYPKIADSRVTPACPRFRVEVSCRLEILCILQEILQGTGYRNNIVTVGY
jgi:hypothetical protein